MFCDWLTSHKSTHTLALTLSVIVVCASVASAKTYMHKATAMGKDYYIVFPKNAYGNQNTAALINSPVKQYITITLPGTGSKYQKLLGPGTSKVHQAFTSIFHTERQSEVTDARGAARFQGSTPFNVVAQYGLTPHISSTYTALPVTSWGTEYWVLDYPEGQNQGYSFYPQVYSVPNFTIIAADSQTQVTIVPSVETSHGHLAGTPFSVALNAGDVYYVNDCDDPSATTSGCNGACTADFSGTHIYSNKPVGVIVGISWANVGCGDNECGDAGQEWLPPVSNWDSEYVVTPSTPDSSAGVVVHVLIGADSTMLTINDLVNGMKTVGPFKAGALYSYASTITLPIVISATGPILPMGFSVTSSTCGGTNNNNNPKAAFSMVIPPGAHQWSDYTTFSTADGGIANTADIFFRTSDFSRLFLNGVPLNQAQPVVQQISNGYSYIHYALNAGQYYELTGDSGATAGGIITGSGPAKGAANNGGGGDVIMDPESAGTFAHPLGINALPMSTKDSTPPECTISYICGHWSIVVTDPNASATGIYDITLAQNNMPDSSFNVQFSPTPLFNYGDTLVAFGIDMINLSVPAQAALHIRDGAGNELDTILTYIPVNLVANPTELNVGALRNLTSTTGYITITNTDSVNPVVINNLRLKFGTQWKMISPLLNLPDTLTPLETDTVFFQYTASNNPNLEIDYDTLMLTTCNTFPFATLVGENKHPAITSTDHDFGCLSIDTLGKGGDTVVLPYAVNIRNTGTDTLHIYGWHITAYDRNNNADAIDSATVNAMFKIYSPAQPVDSAHAINVPRGSNLYFTIWAHPHNSSPQFDTAQIIYLDDAKHVTRDTSILSLCTQTPSPVTEKPVQKIAGLELYSYPNPFTSSTTIAFNAPQTGVYRVNIYNSLGERITTLATHESAVGQYSAEWNAEGWASGVYYYEVASGSSSMRMRQMKEFVLIR